MVIDDFFRSKSVLDSTTRTRQVKIKECYDGLLMGLAHRFNTASMTLFLYEGLIINATVDGNSNPR